MSSLTNTTKTVRRTIEKSAWEIQGDICIIGAGIAGISAAIAAADAGKSVVLVDGNLYLGGQTYNSNIGSFCGFYSNHGEKSKMLTRLGVTEIFHSMHEAQGLLELISDTIVLMYDENIFLRSVEKVLVKRNIQILLGAILYKASFQCRRITKAYVATRYGTVVIHANGFIDASGDASLAWTVGLSCSVPKEQVVFGSEMVILKDVNFNTAPPSVEEINKRAHETKKKYGLNRTKNVIFYFPERGGMFYGNMTHVRILPDPFSATNVSISGKEEADKVLRFLREEFPDTFCNASIHHYPNIGIRQTRSVLSCRQLRLKDIQKGEKFADTIGRTAWPIELHSSEDAYTWDAFEEEHIHYIPLSCMLSAEADNYVAAGRCIDADIFALASVRVMGPCSATGTAAALALSLAGKDSVHSIDIRELQALLKDNLT